MKEFAIIGIVIGGLLMAFIIGGALGVNVGQSACRQYAIEAGAAEWKVDPKTGTTEFVFKPYPESPIPEPK